MQEESPPAISLRHYVKVLRRGWRVIVACVLLGSGAAAALLWVMPPQATASTLVSLSVITSDPFNSNRPASALLDVQAEARVATSRAVAERTATVVDLDARDIRQSLTATPEGNTTLLRISATSGRPDRAQQIADATAEEFLDYRAEQARTRIDRMMEVSLNRLAGLQEELQQLNLAIAAAEPGSTEATQAETDKALTSAEINALFATTANLRAIDTTGGFVLNPASTNTVEYSPSRMMILGTGVLGGLGFGVLGAFVAHATRSRVRTTDDVGRAIGAPALGELRERSVSVPVRGDDLPQFRAIREYFLSHPLTRGRTGTCVVVDQSQSGHAADVALNFAWVVAASGVPVEYIALDGLATPGSHHRLGLPHASPRGDSRVQSTTNPTFSVFLPQAETTGTSTGESMSREVRHEIAARQDETLIVLPLGPATAADDRLAAYRLADIAVLVAESKHTTVAQLTETVGQLTDFDTTVIGSVLVHHGRARQVPIDPIDDDSASDPAARPHERPDGRRRPRPARANA